MALNRAVGCHQINGLSQAPVGTYNPSGSDVEGNNFGLQGTDWMNYKKTILPFLFATEAQVNWVSLSNHQSHRPLTARVSTQSVFTDDTKNGDVCGDSWRVEEEEEEKEEDCL